MISLNTKNFAMELKKLKEIAGGQTLTGESVHFDITENQLKMTVYGSCGTTLMTVLPIMNLGEKGAFIVDIKKLSSIIPQLSCDEITLQKAKSGLRVVGKGIKLELPYVNLPSFKLEKNTHEAKEEIFVSAEDFKKKITETSHALAINKRGEMVSAFCLDFSDTDLRVTATDGSRISIRGKNIETKKNIILPSEAVRKVVKYFNGNITIKKYEDHITLIDGSTSLKVAALSGKYFDISSILKQLYACIDKEIVVNKEELVKAMEIALSMDKEKSLLTIEGSTLVVTSKTMEGAFQQTISANASKDITFNGYINAQYLVDALKSYHGKNEYITLKFGNSKCPLLIEDEKTIEVVFLKVA